MDVEKARKEYKTLLGGLTFNCKPLITDLTQKAELYVRYAPTIVATLEDHIRNAIPPHKIPAIYLLDSIVKNLQKTTPYPGLFAHNIFSLYTSTFEAVNSQDRDRMVRLLETWKRNPMTREGAPIFDMQIINNISKFLSTSSAPIQTSKPAIAQWNQPVRPPTNTGMDGINMLLDQQIHALLRQKESDPNLTPQRKAMEISVLQQIQNVVRTTKLDPNSALQITNQLTQMQMQPNQGQPPPATYSQPPPQMFNRPFPDYSRPVNPMYPPYNGPSTSSPNMHPSQVAPGMYQYPGNYPPMRPNIPPHTNPYSQPSNGAPATSTVKPAVSSPNLLSTGLTVDPTLIDNLMKSGLLNTLGQQTKISKLPVIKLTTADIKIQRPVREVLGPIYDNLPYQCSQCGYRFSEERKNQYSDHLDWHFRMNKRLKKVGVGASRDWYLGLDEWLKGDEGGLGVEFEPTFNNDIPESKQDAGDSDSGQAKVDSENQNLLVDQVPGTLGPCIVCSESFEKFWDEEEEEWMYRDIHQIEDGKYAHHSCYKDSQKRKMARKRSPEVEDGVKKVKLED